MTEFNALQPKTFETADLEVFPKPPHINCVEINVAEITSLCPITGQPDWETVKIEYEPNELCLESKSLKLYLFRFREEGHFCEALAEQIADDIFVVLKPQWLRVSVTQRPRGDVGITARAVRDSYESRRRTLM